MTQSSGPPRRTTLAGLIAALIASLVGGAVAVRAAEGYYRDEQRVRRDPLGLTVHAADREHARAPGGRRVFVMFGDSRVAMWTPPHALDGYDVVNLGVGSQTTSQALLRFDYDVVPQHPSVILIEVGVNDLKDLSLFTEERDEIVQACKENIASLVQKSRALGANVVLTTLFALGDVPVWRRPFLYPVVVTAAIDEVNAFVRTLGTEHVVVFEADPILNTSSGRVNPAFQWGYIHENGAAYEALNERLLPLARGLP